MNKKLTALFLSGSLIFTLGMNALAAEPTDQTMPPTVISENNQSLPSSVLYYGTITDFEKDENGKITKIKLDSERYGEYVMIVSNETVWIDSGNHTADDPSDLEINEGIYVFHSTASTNSLPPQSKAIAVVRNIPQDAGCAQYHVVTDVSKQDNGITKISLDNNSLILSADNDTKMTTYLTKNIVTLDDVKKGSRIMAWYSAVAKSIPAQAYANYIMILPPIEDELKDGAQITMRLDGKVPNMVGRYENGVVMVPVAAVGRAMGFEVNYTADENGQLVTVESDTFSVHLNIGQEQIFGVTKIKDAVGMTAPQSYGKAPYIVDPGTTWAPAEIFTMLGKTVTLEGSNLIIE